MNDEEDEDEGAVEEIEDLDAPAEAQDDIAGGECIQPTKAGCIGKTCEQTKMGCIGTEFPTVYAR